MKEEKDEISAKEFDEAVDTIIADLPSADDSDNLSAALSDPGDPEPFDPFSAIDAAESSDIAMIKDEASKRSDADAPTPNSVAAELKKTVEKITEEKTIEEPKAESHSEAVDEPERREQKPTPNLADIDIAPPTPPRKSVRRIYPTLIFAIALLIGIAAVATANIPVLTRKKNNNTTTKTTPKPATEPEKPADPYKPIIGVWESQIEGGSCYEFSDDYQFYWLRDCQDITDNYYHGSISYLRADDALAEKGMTVQKVSELLKIDEGAIKKDNIYLLTLHPVDRIVNGVDTSSTIGGDISLLFVLTGDGKASGYQFNTNNIYSFEKSE